MPRSTFRALHISGIDFPTLSPSHRARLAENLVEAAEGARWWTDSVGLRFSIAKGIFLLERYVLGSLTQQYNLERHIYADDKEETESSVDSYEDRLFLLDLIEGQLVTEWRQFRARPPLTTPLLLTRFERVLQDTLLGDDSTTHVALSAYEHLTSKAEFLDIFYSTRVLQVDVKAVGQSSIARDVQLVNPNPHLENALRDLLLHDAALSALDELRAEINTNSQGDLRRSAIIRGAMHSGQPSQVTFQDQSGTIRVRRENEKGIMSVDMPVLTTDSPADRLLLAASLIQAVSGISLVAPQPGRPVATDNLELFDDE